MSPPTEERTDWWRHDIISWFFPCSQRSKAPFLANERCDGLHQQKVLQSCRTSTWHTFSCMVKTKETKKVHEMSENSPLMLFVSYLPTYFDLSLKHLTFQGCRTKVWYSKNSPFGMPTKSAGSSLPGRRTKVVSVWRRPFSQTKEFQKMMPMLVGAVGAPFGCLPPKRECFGCQKIQKRVYRAAVRDNLIRWYGWSILESLLKGRKKELVHSFIHP